LAGNKTCGDGRLHDRLGRWPRCPFAFRAVRHASHHSATDFLRET